MGSSQSHQSPHEVPIEQLSHELALRFASKCYSHLEITHFKDNFKTLADHNDDLEYWKEDTLCKFLSLPESIQAGPVIFQMCTYLGAFPFPSLAPCILTREAMVKIVTILTGRYRKVLKKGSKDKTKLLFRSLAVFDRRASTLGEKDRPNIDDITKSSKGGQQSEESKTEQTHVGGFAVDTPLNDNEEEDDDDLALAALDSLDAIEVFKHDQKMERRINRALIPAKNLKRLVMLLLLFGGLRVQESLSAYGNDLDDSRLQALEQSAEAIIKAFDPDPVHKGIVYSKFVKVTSTTVLDLFEPLNAMFEHFLFSKNIDLSKHKGDPTTPKPPQLRHHSPIYRLPDNTSPILTDTILAQLAISLHIASGTSSPTNIFTSHARFDQIFSIATHGTSLSSFSRQVMSWSTTTLFLISGTTSTSQQFLIGAYLTQPWRDSSTSYTSPPSIDPSLPKSTMFQLQPRHAIFRANTANTSIPASYFSNKTGIALGCVIPPQSRTGAPTPPILGPASLRIDDDMSTATFSHDIDQGQGAFVPDPFLTEAQAVHPDTAQTPQTEFDIDALEVWGVSFGSDDDELSRQMQKMKWEDEEAARRRGVNFGGDKDGARHLLEMAGIVGDNAGNRSGGSV